MLRGKGRYSDAGDTVTIDFGEGVTCDYEVLAVGSPPYTLGPQHRHLLDVTFCLPSDELLARVGPLRPLCTTFDVDDANTRRRGLDRRLLRKRGALARL